MLIRLKPAQTSDIDQLISLEKSVSGSKLYMPLLTRVEWEEALKKNQAFFIECDGAIVGKIFYEMKTVDHAYIDGFAVAPAFQRKGIGRQAMEMLLKNLGEMPRIDPVTHPENARAIKLYESLGFKIESRIENYFGDGEPRVRMVLEK